MSEKVAQTLGAVVAENVKNWRISRGLDQQALADRVRELGWRADRTAITRIEKKTRKVTVDDVVLLAVALNVPLTVILTPIDGGDVVATPEGPAKAVNRWWWFEWMIGNEPLPGRVETFGDEWRSGAEPLWLYERVRRAQQETAKHHKLGTEPAAWLAALQDLVDAVAEMEAAGYPAMDLVGPERAKAVKHHGIEPSPSPRRFDLGRATREEGVTS